MQINGFHNKIREYHKAGGNIEAADKQKKQEESFKDSLQKNLGLENGTNAVQEDYRECGDKTKRTLLQTGKALAEKEHALGKNSTLLHVDNADKLWSAENVPVRHIAYAQCDKIDINVLEGFTLKAKMEEAGKDQIYVEAKYDDGREEAYLFDGDKVTGETKNPIERIAYETKINEDY